MNFLSKIILFGLMVASQAFASERGKKTPEPGHLQALKLQSNGMPQATNIMPLSDAKQRIEEQKVITQFLNNPKAAENLHKTGLRGLTRLMHAAGMGTPKMVADHFALGARSILHCIDENGDTAIHCAAAFGKNDDNAKYSKHALEVLFENGGDLYQVNKKGQTPLTLALVHRNTNSMDTLLELIIYDAQIHPNADRAADRALDCLEKAIKYATDNNYKVAASEFTKVSKQLKELNREVEQPHEIDAPKEIEEQDDLEMMKEIEQKGLKEPTEELRAAIRAGNLEAFTSNLKDPFVKEYFTSLKNSKGCNILMYAAHYGTSAFLDAIAKLFKTKEATIKDYLTQESKSGQTAVMFTFQPDNVENLRWFLDNNLIDLEEKIGRQCLSLIEEVYSRDAPKCLREIIRRYKVRNFQKVFSLIESTLKNYQPNHKSANSAKLAILQEEYAQMKDEYNSAASKTVSRSTFETITRANQFVSIQQSQAQALAAAAVAATQTAATAGPSQTNANNVSMQGNL